MKHHRPGSSGSNDAVTIDLSPSMPAIIAPSKRPPSSVGAKRKPNAIPVRTEFVFCATQHHSSVLLCGDWDDWHPIHMTLEQEYLWSVITVVPTGYRQFFYMVDGSFMLSTKHPTNADGTRNWRTVYGPPRSLRNRISAAHGTQLETALHSLSESIRNFFLAAFHPEQLMKRAERRMSSSVSIELVQDIENSVVSPSTSKAWHYSCNSPVRVVVSCLVVYGVAVLVVRVFR